jgi:hypothetical protein
VREGIESGGVVGGGKRGEYELVRASERSREGNREGERERQGGRERERERE